MSRKAFLHWADLMIEAAPSYVTSGTPALLMAVNEVLTMLGSVHATVGWQVQALSYLLLAGNFLRRGLESGLIVRELGAVRTEYERFRHPVALSQPLAPRDPVDASRAVALLDAAFRDVEAPRGY